MPHLRKKYSTPRKGTKSRGVLLHMLRPSGMTAIEGLEKGLLTRRSDLSALLDQFINTGGWDIRSFPDRGTAPHPRGAPPVLRYRVVGRSRWGSNGYRSFVDSSVIID